MSVKKINLKGLSLNELEDFFQELNEEKFRARQLFSWIYQQKATSFELMTNLSASLRERLTKVATIDNLKIVAEQSSNKSKTQKYLFKCFDDALIESVLIPDQNRLTLCLSTQVGCPLDCKFCATGQMGYKRNLSTGEIIDQYLQISRINSEPITNIVYMGMGEPFLNFSNVINSMNIFSSELAFGISGKRVTVSTVGIPDKIKTFAQEPFRGKLAFSLHSVDEQIRSKIMPINKKFPFKQNIEALEYFYKTTKRRITFEYILLKGINDQESDIKGIVKLSKRIPCKINIIPFNSISHTNPSGVAATLKPTSKDEFDFFVERLRSNNVTVFVRNTQGDDIDGACGQLAIKL